MPGDLLSRNSLSIHDLYLDRRRRALELQASGRQVVGYFCCYPPVELMTALDFVPFRIHGNPARIVSAANAYLESDSCYFVRSCFDLALDGYYDFFDGLVVPHSCDTIDKIFNIWRYFSRAKLTHLLNVPHMLQSSSFAFFKEELERFQQALEGLAGRKLERAALVEAIALHNENRALLRRLYELRKRTPPPISASEVLKVIVAGMCLPVAEHNDLVRQLLLDVETRPVKPDTMRPRVMVVGSELDYVDFLQLVEEAGADVVVEDFCTSTRSFWPDVPLTNDPLDGIAERYLRDINCPRTYRPQQASRAADLQNRFGYLARFARDFNVSAVVTYTIRFCDTHALDAPDIADYFRSLAIPVLPLEEEYRVANVGQIKTRLEAFLETIGS